MNDNWREDSSQQAPRERSGGPQARNWITAALVVVGIVIAGVFARQAVTSAVLFIGILLALVLAHEAAHFVTAKLFGIRVHEFGVGFPPRIWGKRIGETEYTVNWLPIGGFVRLEGEENPTGPRSLAARPAWQRLIVLGSGAVVNLILPVFLFAAALTIPHQEAEGRAVISQVMADSPAEAAGLQAGDVIIAVEGRNAKNLVEASRYVRIYQGRVIDMTVRRAGEEITIPVQSRWNVPDGQGPTGIQISPEAVNPVDGQAFTVTVAMPPWESIPEGFRLTYDTMLLARNQIISWVKGTSSPEFQGPVGIAQTTGEVAASADSKTGAISPLLELAALLSINLGVMNLLPLPMLDGGRMFFVVIKALPGGKKITPEREAIVHLVGFVAFMALALVVTFLDISRIASGDSVFR